MELRANIRFRKGFRSVIKDSAVAIRPRKPNFFRRSFVQKTTFLCKNNVVEILYGFRGLHETVEAAFGGLYETEEAASAVYMRPRKRFPRSLLDRRSHTFPTIISKTEGRKSRVPLTKSAADWNGKLSQVPEV
jgi:hypothetical protein